MCVYPDIARPNVPDHAGVPADPISTPNSADASRASDGSAFLPTIDKPLDVRSVEEMAGILEQRLQAALDGLQDRSAAKQSLADAMKFRDVAIASVKRLRRRIDDLLVRLSLNG